MKSSVLKWSLGSQRAARPVPSGRRLEGAFTTPTSLPTLRAPSETPSHTPFTKTWTSPPRSAWSSIQVRGHVARSESRVASPAVLSSVSRAQGPLSAAGTKSALPATSALPTTAVSEQDSPHPPALLVTSRSAAPAPPGRLCTTDSASRTPPHPRPPSRTPLPKPPPCPP